MNLSRSTASFAMRLLLSVAVVYRFFPAENKSIFAQRYGPCTPPDGTKHTNVRRAETKYKTIVKDMHYPLIPCGFSTLAPLAKMRYTGNTKTNVKENSRSQNRTGTPSVLPLRVKPPAPHSVANATSLPGRGESVQGDGFSGSEKVSGIAQSLPLGGAGCERSEQTEGVFRERLRGRAR